ncbi:MAG TPA: 2Fe-2S iron-sulfur cluster-binding protein [Pelomicrobium sp.]|nr:2Fe-2S iron-sulfur cluster-binding protein [Pelomicrobium sp.]
MSEAGTIVIDGRAVPFRDGESVMEAALGAGIYIAHLCYHPDYVPHGSCKLCTVSINGKHAAACTTRAAAGMTIENETPALNDMRCALIQMLFVEGNHICPACEKTGACDLQAVGYHVGMTNPHFEHFFPSRDLDASHPDVLLDRNRCILCSLCVRASRDVDAKRVFAINGRGIRARLTVNSPSGRLADSALAAHDAAVAVCPVGSILRKRAAYHTPIGERRYDRETIAEVAVREYTQRRRRHG